MTKRMIGGQDMACIRDDDTGSKFAGIEFRFTWANRGSIRGCDGSRDGDNGMSRPFSDFL